MKETEIEKKIMNRIFRFEKKRILFNILVFFLFLLSVSLLFFFVGKFVFRQLLEQQTLDLLTIFFADLETILAFGKDSLTTFWLESPHEQLLFLIILFILLITSLAVFLLRLPKISRKIKTISSLKHQ